MSSPEKYAGRLRGFMTLLHLGIRGRINAVLGSVILVATLVFGSGYALLERSTILESKREHLQHLAALVEIQIATATGPDELERVLDEFGRDLLEATKVKHQLDVTSANGRVLATTLDEGAELARPDRKPARFGLFFPPSLEVAVPLRLTRYVPSEPERQPAWLKLAEPLEDLRPHVLASLLRHFFFAGGLVGLAMLLVGGIVHRMVVRPVRELAMAAEGIARGNHWEPIHPSMRRDDEIGMLADRMADMSRRLADAVRIERYGSAHLVAARVRRELDEPVRRVRIELEMLKRVASDSDTAQVCDEIADAIQEILEIGRRLGEARPTPPA